MDWIERLNRSVGIIPIGQGRAELLHWASELTLADNKPHRHTYFEICQVGAHGAGEFRAQGQASKIGPGDVFFARPGIEHQIINTQHPGMELCWVSFQWLPGGESGQTETDALLRAFAESPLLMVADTNGSVGAVWQALRAVAEGAVRPGQEMQISALTAALILALAQAGAGPNAPEAAELTGPDAGAMTARLAVRYVHDNLSRPLTVAEIAAHVHTSPRHLTRLFEALTGTPPALYITRARIDRARGLLMRSELPIKEVAVLVGYPDVHHFTRVFRHYVGTPPARFRQEPNNRGDKDVLNLHNPGALV